VLAKSIVCAASAVIVEAITDLSATRMDLWVQIIAVFSGPEAIVVFIDGNACTGHNGETEKKESEESIFCHGRLQCGLMPRPGSIPENDETEFS
jgi:hypothetical protein